MGLIKQLSRIQKELNNLQNELEKEDVSLLPPNANLENALMTLTDSEGNQIGIWRIKDGDIEDALETLQLEPEVQKNE